MYKLATEADEKERTLMALGYAPGGSRVQATLQFALSEDVRAQVRRRRQQHARRHGGRGCQPAGDSTRAFGDGTAWCAAWWLFNAAAPAVSRCPRRMRAW